jgi:APA family basic amino acid/polyamine antiporter
MTLKKDIGLLAGVSILTGIMIGSGIFFFGTVVFGLASNSLGLSLLAWILGGLVTLVSALSYAELGTLFPNTGGYYVYLRKAYGKPIAFLSGWMNFFLSSSGSITTLAFLFAYIFVVGPLQLDYNQDLIRMIALAVIILFGAINYFGVKLGSLTQIIFTIAKLVPIVIIIGLGLFLGTQTVDLSLASLTPDVDLGVLLSGFTFAIARTLFAYEGWTNLNTVAGEMKNPKRDLPLALLISVGLVTVVYVLFIFALYRVLDVPFLIAQSELGVNNQAIFFAVGTVLQGDYSLWVMIAILISILGAINGTLLAFPRVYFAMAEDGTMPKVLSHTSKFGTPDVAILGSVVMASVLLFFDIDTLLTFVLLPALVFNTLIFFSVFIFRKTMPNAERPYRVWGYPVVPAIAILGMVILIYYTFENSFIPSLIGLGVLTLGWFVYPIIFKQLRK